MFREAAETGGGSRYRGIIRALRRVAVRVASVTRQRSILSSRWHSIGYRNWPPPGIGYRGGKKKSADVSRMSYKDALRRNSDVGWLMHGKIRWNFVQPRKTKGPQMMFDKLKITQPQKWKTQYVTRRKEAGISPRKSNKVVSFATPNGIPGSQCCSLYVHNMGSSRETGICCQIFEIWDCPAYGSTIYCVGIRSISRKPPYADTVSKSWNHNPYHMCSPYLNPIHGNFVRTNSDWNKYPGQFNSLLYCFSTLITL